MDRYSDICELPEDLINLDLSLLDDALLFGPEKTFDGAKSSQDFVQKDTNLLDTWMNDVASVVKTESDCTKYVTSQATVEATESTPASTISSDLITRSATDDVGQPLACINDAKLLELSVKDLNNLVRSLPKDEVKDIKQRRRTLKNRGYARSCRVRKHEEKNNLQRCNEDLENDIANLKKELDSVMAERDIYKSRLENLARRIVQRRV